MKSTFRAKSSRPPFFRRELLPACRYLLNLIATPPQVTGLAVYLLSQAFKVIGTISGIRR
jgi:hypothetical protein